MPTIVPKTIGSTGDYPTPPLWVSAIPSNIVTTDEVWKGQLQNQHFSTAVQITISGITTDATRYVDLDTVAGASWRDNASPVGRFDSSKGAAITCTGYANDALAVSIQDFKMHNMQLAQTGGGNRRAFSHFSNGVSTNIIENCVFEGVDAGPRTRYGTIRNSLSIVRGAGGDGWNFDYYTGGTVAGLVVARPTDWSAAATGFNSINAITMKDCASVGFSAFSAGGGTFSGSNNATDLGAVGFGTSNQVSVARSTANFVGVTDAARDFRIVTGSALKNNGVTDTTTIPAADDAFGTSRPQGSAWDIGFHEFITASSFVPTLRPLIVTQAVNRASTF